MSCTLEIAARKVASGYCDDIRDSLIQIPLNNFVMSARAFSFTNPNLRLVWVYCNIAM